MEGGVLLLLKGEHLLARGATLGEKARGVVFVQYIARRPSTIALI